MKDSGNACKLSLDGTDCPIQEPIPFNPKYFSHKFNGAGVKYELGICIKTGWICWFNGPFPCGVVDITIARLGIVEYLDSHKKILADGGKKFDTPSGLHNVGQRMRSLCRARHETINGRVKKFAVTSTRFRHRLKKHQQCFHAIMVLTQMDIMLHDTNFEVYYNEDIDFAVL
jgi:hypothetical protein